MQMCRHAGDAARKNFAAFSDKFFEQVWILVVDRFCGNIDPSTWHHPVGPSEIRSAFGVFRFHCLLDLPMKGASAQKRIVLFLLQSARCIQAFFVARADVTGNRFTFRLRLRALKSDDFPRHELILRIGDRVFFFSFTTLLIGQAEKRGDRLADT
jgi:hypothetical protein